MCHVGEGLEVLRELEEDVDVVVGPVGRVLLQALPDGVPHDQGRLLQLVALLYRNTTGYIGYTVTKSGIARL